jgi:hypothetical protein
MERAALTLLFVQIAIVGTIGLGWIFNIIDLTGMSLDDGLTLELGLRIVGIVFPPLGAIMGWFV